MNILKFVEMYGWCVGVFVAGLVSGWLAARVFFIKRLSTEKTNAAILAESMRGKSEAMESLRKSLTDADLEIAELNERFLELSKKHASAESSLEQNEAFSSARSSILRFLSIKFC